MSEYIEILVENNERGQDIVLEVEKESVGNFPTYMGKYIITPNDEEQRLQTAYRMLTENIIIAPIPREYGKIAWDGIKLTIT